MSVTVNTTIQRRRDTTETWEYTNPILADREQGFETDSYGLPIGMKMGDGINHWDDLPYWFTNAVTVPFEAIFIAQGTPIPYNIDMSTRGQFGLRPTIMVEINPYDDGGTQDTSKLVEWPSIQRICNYRDSAYSILDSIAIVGNPDDDGNFNEDTYVTLKI